MGFEGDSEMGVRNKQRIPQKHKDCLGWFLLLLAFIFSAFVYESILTNSLSENGLGNVRVVSPAVVWPLYVSMILLFLLFVVNPVGDRKRRRKHNERPISGFVPFGLSITLWVCALPLVITASVSETLATALGTAVAAENLIALSIIFAFVSGFTRKYNSEDKSENKLGAAYVSLLIGLTMLLIALVFRTVTETVVIINMADLYDDGYGTVRGISAGLIVTSGFFVTFAEISLWRTARGVQGVETISFMSAMSVFLLGAVAFYAPNVLEMSTYDIVLRVLFGILFSIVLATTFTSTALCYFDEKSEKQ